MEYKNMEIVTNITQYIIDNNGDMDSFYSSIYCNYNGTRAFVIENNDKSLSSQAK